MKIKLSWLISFANAIFSFEKCRDNCSMDLAKCFEDCEKLENSDGRYAILQQTRTIGINFEEDKMESIHGFNMNGHEVDFATSVEHEGEFYVIGGLVMDAISKVGNCGLQEGVTERGCFCLEVSVEL